MMCIRDKNKLALLLIVNAIFGTAHAKVPNTEHPTTFLGPVLSFDFLHALSPTRAFNFLGEAGPRHFRANATLGFELYDYNRLKVTGEYLSQDINYAFFSGNSLEWVHQYAVGAGFQQDINACFFSPQFDLTAYFSHAPSRNLTTVTGTFIDSSGLALNFTDNRRIAGSNATGGKAGLTVLPWWGAKIGVYLNYDSVRYDTRLDTSFHENANGFGGSAIYNQNLNNGLMLELSGANRQPFNNYQASLTWGNLHWLGSWTAGAYGEFTDGKNTLPNTWNVGIILNFQHDCSPVSFTGSQISYKNEIPATPTSQSNQFIQWVSDPAVRMPQVLAIVNPVPICIGVQLISPFADIFFPFADNNTVQPISVDAASHFSGSDLTFSFVSAPSGLTIDSKTGQISGSLLINATTIYTVVVRAANTCGIATGSFTIQLSL